MSYSPSTDLIGLLRQTSSGSRAVRMPGLDYLVSGLARAGMFTLWTGASAPVVNQAVTVWLSPYDPSWAAEGFVYLWNDAVAEYEPATPALWAALFSAAAVFTDHFQAVTGASATVNDNTTLLAVERAAPAATALLLPSVLSRTGAPLRLVDWSTAVTDHAITLTPAAGQTIMRAATWPFYSNAAQLGSLTLYPSTDLNGWYTAP